MNMKSMSMYSTQYLVGPPFAWIAAAMRRGMESISLWHCSGVMRAQVALIVAFSSSALLGLAYRIFLFTIPHRFSLDTSVRSGSWSTDSSCSPLFVNLPHIFEWVLFHNPLQGAVIPIACTLFSTTSFPSLRLSINVLGHRALWTASLFCDDLLCLALLVQDVNGRLLDNCQVSSLPHDCVAYRTRLRDHLKAFAGVLS